MVAGTRTMANVYAVRIHEVENTRARLGTLLDSIDGSYVFARETDAERAHFQGWIRSDIKNQALRMRIKKVFPEAVGNKGYSLTAVKDFEAYSAYIMKGTREEVADVVFHSGIEMSATYVADEHRRYWSKHGEKATKTNRAIVEEVREWYMSQKFDEDVDVREVIAYRLCETYAARNKGINVFQMRMYTNTVQWHVDPSCRQNIISEIKNKF